MLKTLLCALLLPWLLSCAGTPPKSGVLAPTCGKTAVQESDMEMFGFKPVPGKVVVMRIFATWCPFCKTDLAKISAEYTSKRWTPDRVNLFLLAYRNRAETRATFDAFVKSTLGDLHIPREALQIQYFDKPYEEAVKTKNAKGETLFDTWKGIPFGLVFGKDGRLAFRGHFTMNDTYEEAHYKFITDLQKETCTP